MKYFLPANLDINELLRKHPPVIKGFKKDHLAYILHLIISIPANNKGLDIRDGFVPINSSILQRKVRNYRAYFDYLQANKVIQIDNQYIIGKKSRGYRFTSKYNRSIKQVEVTDKTLLRLVKRENQISSQVKRKYNHLLKWYNAGLQINYDLAMEYIQADLDRKFSHSVSRHASVANKDPWQQYNSAVVNIEKFAAAAFSVSVDNNVFRLHSILSNLPSSLRNCLTFNGVDLVSIDIKNCQPYLSTALLNSSFWVDKGETSSMLNVADVFPSYKIDIFSSSSSLLSSFIMLCKEIENCNDCDLQNYVELVKEGTFYEYIGREMLKCKVIHDCERKKLKAAVFQVLFTDNRYIGQTEAEPKRLFKKHFPKVYELFSRIKRLDKTSLPRLLQKMESHLVLLVIAKRIARERSDVPIFTIHDSIVTTNGSEEYVQSIITEEMKKAIGFPPQLSVEHWQPENLKLSDGSLFSRTGQIAA